MSFSSKGGGILFSRRTGIKVAWTFIILVITLFCSLASSDRYSDIYKNPMKPVNTSSITLVEDSFNQSYSGPKIDEKLFQEYCTEARVETYRAKADGSPKMAVYKLGDGRKYNLLECPASPKPIYVLSVDILESKPLLYAYYVPVD